MNRFLSISFVRFLCAASAVSICGVHAQVNESIGEVGFLGNDPLLLAFAADAGSDAGIPEIPISSSEAVADPDAKGVSVKVRRDGDGRAIMLLFDADKTRYYEIWSADSLAGPWSLEDLVLGRNLEQAWNIERAITGSAYYRMVQRPLVEPGDADKDGFDDVYELMHSGFNPLKPDGVEVEVINVSSTRIAAGALSSAPHQTEIEIRLNRAGAYPVAVWLEGGEGHGADKVNDCLPGGTMEGEGSAKLASAGQIFVAGGGSRSERAMGLTTNEEGRAVLVLTSSNEAGQTCRVHARAGTRSDFSDSQGQSSLITFEKGTVEVAMPRVIVGPALTSVTVTRTFNGVPLVGHDMAIYVRHVRVNGETRRLDPCQPNGLSEFASIEPGEMRQPTDEFGQATASIQLHSATGLDYFEVEAVDLRVIER